MEAHEALERFEKVSQGRRLDESLGLHAALVVAVLAGFLAVATLLSNETVKQVITGETRAARTDATLQRNDLKKLIAENDSTLLKALGAGGNVMQGAAVAKARALETRIAVELAPIEGALRTRVAAEDRKSARADNRHAIYELAVTALQLGIVAAGISILARQRWLLTGGEAVGVVGVALTLAGLTY